MVSIYKCFSFLLGSATTNHAICEISQWNGIFQAQVTFAATPIAGFGKLAALVGAKFQGGT